MSIHASDVISALHKVEGMFSLHELKEKSKNPNYQIKANQFGDSNAHLRKHGLLDAKGDVPERVRQIALEVIGDQVVCATLHPEKIKIRLPEGEG